MAFQNHSECLSTFQKFKGGVMDIKNFETAYLNAGGKSSELEKEDGEYVSSKSQMGWQMWLAAKAHAVPEEPKRQGGYYIRDLRNQPGNCMKFWYKSGYGAKHKNFFWCETLEQAKKYQGGCDWFEIWHAPYIDSLVEYTVDFQLADRGVGLINLEAQEQKG